MAMVCALAGYYKFGLLVVLFLLPLSFRYSDKGVVYPKLQHYQEMD